MVRRRVRDSFATVVHQCKELLLKRRLLRQHPQMMHAFAIKSHLTYQERVQLTRLASGRKQICEIGSYTGASACCFGAAMNGAAAGGAILCVDTWHNEAMTEGLRDTFAEFRQNTAEYGQFIVPIQGFSADVVDKVADRVSQVDLLFIDGDHSYEGVKTDWERYRRFLGPGSVVVFHDSGWAEGVRRVIAEDVKPRVSSSDSLPNMWWGTIGAPMALCTLAGEIDAERHHPDAEPRGSAWVGTAIAGRSTPSPE